MTRNGLVRDRFVISARKEWEPLQVRNLPRPDCLERRVAARDAFRSGIESIVLEDVSLYDARVSKIASSARSVPTHEGFYFYRDIGDPTGEVATSLGDFLDKLRATDVRSIEFHLKRQDFEKWTKDVLADDALSRRISGINRTAHGEELREQITKVVKSRLEELALATSNANVIRARNEDRTRTQFTQAP